MNSRFKFRVWDDTNKRYLPASDAIIDGRTGMKFHGPIFSAVYIIEQCTGLTDLNGKLIYEGDIVEFTYFDYNGKDYQIEGTIEYGEFGLMLRKVNKGHETFVDAGDDLYFYAWLGEFDFDPEACIEIIGNIHEMEIGVEE